MYKFLMSPFHNNYFSNISDFTKIRLLSLSPAFAKWQHPTVQVDTQDFQFGGPYYVKEQQRYKRCFPQKFIVLKDVAIPVFPKLTGVDAQDVCEEHKKQLARLALSVGRLLVFTTSPKYPSALGSGTFSLQISIKYLFL